VARTAAAPLSWLLARSWMGRKPSRSADGDTIACTVFGPNSVPPKERCLIQVYVHMFDNGAQAVVMASEFDPSAARLGVRNLEFAVKAGTQLTFVLSLPGLVVDDPIQSLTWNRRMEAVSFGVEVPDDCQLGAFIGSVTVSVDGIPAGRIRFRISVTADARPSGGKLLQPKGEDARHYRLAFISYASQDRNKVLARVQMLRLLNIEYFQDLLNLEPGERWENALYRHIDECDLFLLFWSKAASESQWVLREIRYAIARKGGDDNAPPAIHPVIIEGPPIVPPPPELRHLHFNDRLIHFMSPQLP
jgi:TIR domain